MKRIIGAVLVAALACVACGKLAQLDQQAAKLIQGKVENKIENKISSSAGGGNLQVPTSLHVKSSEESSDDALLQKLNGYIECLNRALPRAQDSYKRYLSWVNKQTGPTCTETYITYGLYSLYDDSMARCQKAVDAGKSSGPSLPDLESAAADLASCNATLVPLVKKANDYYEQQDYRDDKCAKGKEMHPQLIATFEKCFDAAKKLSDGVDKLKVDLDKRRLARMDQAGASLQAEVMRVLISGKDLLTTINLNGQGNPVSKDAYIPKCQEFEKNFQKMDDYATAHKDEVDKTFWGSAFIDSAKNFNAAAKFLRRDLEDGKDPRSEVEAFVEKYNSMIGDSNNLNFNFGR